MMKRWTGEGCINVVSSKRKSFDDDRFYGVLEFCRIICASIYMMEKDASLENKSSRLSKTTR